MLASQEPVVGPANENYDDPLLSAGSSRQSVVTLANRRYCACVMGERNVTFWTDTATAPQLRVAAEFNDRVLSDRPETYEAAEVVKRKATGVSRDARTLGALSLWLPASLLAAKGQVTSLSGVNGMYARSNLECLHWLYPSVSLQGMSQSARKVKVSARQPHLPCSTDLAGIEDFGPLIVRENHGCDLDWKPRK